MLSFNDLFREHADLVFNLCLHYLRNRAEAEEATQDIFVKIHGKLSSFEGKSSVKTWVYRVAIHHCLDVLRGRKRRNRLAVVVHRWLGAGDAPVEVPHFDHPGVLLEDQEALENLFAHIHRLPENQKTALILRYLDDLPPPAVAEVMGLSLKAVESLLQRAKQNLEKKLEGTR